VTLDSGNGPSEDLRQELRKWVTKEIGALARPDDLRFTQMLPRHAPARSCADCCASWQPPAT